MNALELRQVSKSFGDFTAVQDLSFDVPAGSVYGLLGPNGAGKTTTIRMIMNILVPDRGEIRVLGKAMDDGMKARVGYLPEDRGLYPKMKVAEIILFLAEIKGLPRDRAAAQMDRWVRRFDLEAWTGKKVEQLSKGMQQKVQFIVTIIHQPDLIILDEPFAGLDPVNTKLLKDVMLELRAEGRTVIFSTHRMEQVEMICEKICLINKSRMVLEGRLDEIKGRYGKNTVLLDYSGDGSFVAGIPGVERVDDYGRSMEVKLGDGGDAQRVLRAAAERLTVHRFEVREPSLNTIFIEQVGGKGE